MKVLEVRLFSRETNEELSGSFSPVPVILETEDAQEQIDQINEFIFSEFNDLMRSEVEEDPVDYPYEEATEKKYDSSAVKFESWVGYMYSNADRF